MKLIKQQTKPMFSTYTYEDGSLINEFQTSCVYTDKTNRITVSISGESEMNTSGGFDMYPVPDITKYTEEQIFQESTLYDVELLHKVQVEINKIKSGEYNK